MFVEDILFILDKMTLTIVATTFASILGCGFLYYRFKNGIVFRIGLSIAIMATYTGLLVDFFTYTQERFGDSFIFAVFVAVIVGLLLLVFISIYLNNTIISPINKVISYSKEISKGNLQLEITDWSKNDEIGKLLYSYQVMINTLTPAVTKMTKSSGIMSQSLKELKSDIEEINDSSEAIAAIAQKLSQDMNVQANMIETTFNQFSKLQSTFKDNLNQINQTATLIESIAAQVNMLSLNASIEAARAGEYGRGFVVVAENIRSLSDDTKNYVTNVRNLVEKLNSSTTNSIKDITYSMETLTQISQKTATSTQETQITTAEQTATTQEISAQMQEITKVSRELEKFIDLFKI